MAGPRDEARAKRFGGARRAGAGRSRVTPYAVYGALIGLPALLFLAFRTSPDADWFYRSLSFHLFVTTSIAVCALVVALLAARAATRVRQPGVVLLAAGCLAVGAAMLVHGVTTPGVFGRPVNAWVGRAPYLGIMLFDVALIAASCNGGGRVRQWIAQHPLAVLATESAVLFPGAIAIMIRPRIFHGAAPYAAEVRAQIVVMIACVATLLPVSWVHWRRWRLGRDVVQLALCAAASMSAAAMLSLRLGTIWRVSWWNYHGYLLAGFGAAVYAIVKRFWSTRAIHDVLSETFAVDPLVHVRHNYPEAMRTLVNAVEAKDTYTHGHSRRTAELATALGERLGLVPEQLRILAQGAYLHDVGKIAIPDEILNKPGALTPDERRVIETHAELGAEMVERAPSLQACVPIVRHHHERWDGGGYPSGLASHEIPFLAAVTAVADVWDALTSDRSYRPGWEPNQALAHIVAGRSSHFHPRAVDALVELAREWGYTFGPVDGDSGVAIDALQDCHNAHESNALLVSLKKSA